MAWWNVSREETSGLPTMLVQAVVAAAALCIGEIVCAPVYLNMASHRLALVPWALVACLLAVVFTYTVGFALLWCAEGLTSRLAERYRPLPYAMTGMIGFGFWGRFTITAFLNSLLRPLGLSALSSGQTTLIVVNSAVLGFAAFFLGYVIAKPFTRKRGLIIGLCVATVLLAIIGAYYLSRMYAVLY